jgi:hypothetical protein
MTEDNRERLLQPAREASASSETTSPAPGGLPPHEPAETAAEGDAVHFVQPPAGSIEFGAFTQLLTASQQCGLVANADAIVTARDREFRLGRYQRAFDIIEGLYLQLNARAAQRQGELRQQEMQYKSGTLKLTPREWMLRQRQATEQAQKIERARRQFARLLDGLRVLRASQPE